MAKVVSISENSIFADTLRIGDEITEINGFPPIDALDLLFNEAQEHIEIKYLRDGAQNIVRINKEEYEPLGIELDSTAEIEPIRCKNKCKFCFVDQLPQGMRETLYVKDDDYRLSFISGNYITLTNCGDDETDRIIRLGLSPIYVSVHSTDAQVKTLLVANPEGAKTYEKLKKLTSNGIDAHAQIVVCPGINDGDILKKTINDLHALGDRMKSVACVPVGLTKHRDKLYKLNMFKSYEAEKVIDAIESFNREHGVNFVYASDEFYIQAGRELPSYEYYGDFEQIENGVGLVRMFENELDYALEKTRGNKKRAEVTFITGKSFAWFLDSKLKYIKTKYPNYRIEVLEVANEFFGETITVAGLITAGDIIKQCKGRTASNIVIPSNMLREFTDCFLDGITLPELEKEMGAKAFVSKDGADVIRILNEIKPRLFGRIVSREVK